ncbi:hypothetical protein T265_08690 [Opisthorchis viverrini]|uniref:Uncharacterized protein n=1 Tax=Opisthorchis viverrini TaxID=6198 RepID=A0A074ZCR5_OPIVI|nr:hypothetical protein T265_08690 [Opisthorchis viverrini]KER23417.1 hypothetical protein T265_08690 [Opisthorchis viverrini]
MGTPRRATSMVGDIVRRLSRALNGVHAVLHDVDPETVYINGWRDCKSWPSRAPSGAHASELSPSVHSSPPRRALDSSLTVQDLCTNLSAPACNAQLPTPYPQIIGERNCGSYKHCTATTRSYIITGRRGGIHPLYPAPTMSPRLVMKRLQSNCQARRTDQQPDGNFARCNIRETGTTKLEETRPFASVKIKKHSAVAPFRSLPAMPTDVCTRAGILSGCLSPDRESREAEAGFEPRTFRHGARWTKWLEREFTDRKIRGSNPTSATRLLLSRLGRPGSIPDVVTPCGMAARHRKAVTPFRCLAVMPHEESVRTKRVPGCPNRDGSQQAEVGFEPRTLQSEGNSLYILRQFANAPGSISIPEVAKIDRRASGRASIEKLNRNSERGQSYFPLLKNSFTHPDLEEPLSHFVDWFYSY